MKKRNKLKETTRAIKSHKRWRGDTYHGMTPLIFLMCNKQEQLSADVSENRSSKKFRNIHKKKPVLESLFNKVASLKACDFVKKRLRYFL